MCAMSIENLEQITIKTKCIIWRNFRLPHPGMKLRSSIFTMDNTDWYFEVVCSWKDREVKNYDFKPVKIRGEVWNFKINCSGKAKVSDYVIIPYVETTHQKYFRLNPTISNTELWRDSLKRILRSERDVVTMMFEFSPDCTDINFKGVLLEDGLDNESVQSMCLNGLSKDIGEMFEDSEKCDVTVKCGGKSFSVHRNIITARSDILFRMFHADMVEKRTGILNIVDIEENYVEYFLRFLYSGKVEEMSLEVALKLYNAADKYAVLTLRKLCASFILDNISEEMICELLLLADRTGDTEFHKGIASFAARRDRFLQTEEWKNFAEQNPSAAIKVYVP